jgi:LSD1 subclass zinc finger protein
MSPKAERVVCAACGVVAPQRLKVCENCEGSIEHPLAVLEDPDLFWTAVDCSFECRACNNRSPLDSLDYDGTLQCASCGVRQDFDPGAWQKHLELAHAVGDLAGPDSLGRFTSRVDLGDDNVLQDVGVTRTFVKTDWSDARRLELRSAPGHPLCGSCRAPLVVASRGRGTLSISCPSCQTQKNYAWRSEVQRSVPGLVGLVADEHQIGGTEASVQREESGAIAAHCPRCGGPITAVGRAGVVECTFCRCAVRIPAATLRSLGMLDLRPALWWLLWQGPSKQRHELEQRQRTEKKSSPTTRASRASTPTR